MVSTREVKHKCPVCSKKVDRALGEHIRSQHGQSEFERAVVEAKAGGSGDAAIGASFGITFGQLEQIITRAYDVNISNLQKRKRIVQWGPSNFHEETTTVWSFKQRGSWATHDGRYPLPMENVKKIRS